MSISMNGDSGPLLSDLKKAHDRLNARLGAVEPPRFPDTESAKTWAGEHQAALIEEVTKAAGRGRVDDAVDIADLLLAFLLLDDRFDEAVDMAQTCLTAARASARRRAEGVALLHLGDIRLARPEAGDPIEPLRASSDILLEVGDREHEASARISLGIALSHDGTRDEADGFLVAAVGLCRELGDDELEANALLYRASNLRFALRYDDAVEPARRAADLFARSGRPDLEAPALLVLGVAHREAARFGEAIPVLQRVTRYFVEIGDVHSEAAALLALGMALTDSGEAEDAIGLLRRSAVITADLGEEDDEADVNLQLGLALVKLGRYEEAIAPLRSRAIHSAAVGDRDGESGAAIVLGTAYGKTGRHTDAVRTYRQALTLLDLDEPGQRSAYGTASAALGLALIQVKQFAEAVEPLRQAAGVYAEAGDKTRAATMLELAKAAQKKDRQGKGLFSRRR